MPDETTTDEKPRTSPGGTAPGPETRSIVRYALDDLSRFRKITNVLARYGFGEVASRAGLNTGSAQVDESERAAAPTDTVTAAARFRAVLEELGPTFVKVGQILSTRPDLLPPAFVEELRTLQDAARPIAFEEIRDVVELGLGAPLTELYETFEPQPLASASMAQAHLATLPGGQEVVVKVQRPGIADTIRSDLDLLHLLARLLERTIQEMELYAPGDVVAALDESLSAELDFMHEASNIEVFLENFDGDDEVVIPQLYRDRTCKTVLTLERIHGAKIDAVEPGSERAQKLARIALRAGYEMVFEHGAFHGDPHPGNVFVTDADQIAYIDFGLCGYLSSTQQEHLVSLVVSVVGGDIDGIARVLLRMGRPLGHLSLARFKAEIASIRDRYLKRSLQQIDIGKFTEEVMEAAQRYRIRIAPEYAILTKAVVTLEGVIRTLDPDLDLVAVGRPYAKEMLRKRYSSEQLMKNAVSGALGLTSFLREVPTQLDQVLIDLESGTLTLRVENEPLEELSSQLNAQTTRMFLGLLSIASAIAAPLWYSNEIWHIGSLPVMTTLSILGTVIFGGWGLLWHLFHGRLGKLRLAPLMRLIRRWRS